MNLFTSRLRLIQKNLDLIFSIVLSVPRCPAVSLQCSSFIVISTSFLGMRYSYLLFLNLSSLIHQIDEVFNDSQVRQVFQQFLLNIIQIFLLILYLSWLRSLDSMIVFNHLRFGSDIWNSFVRLLLVPTMLFSTPIKFTIILVSESSSDLSPSNRPDGPLRVLSDSSRSLLQLPFTPIWAMLFHQLLRSPWYHFLTAHFLYHRTESLVC